MRITRDALIKLARDFSDKRLIPDRNVTAVFLVGSVLSDSAFIGNAADIDMLVIYGIEPFRTREIVKLSNNVHLDVFYEAASFYAHPRELRGDPWRGWAMWDPLLLHEKGRFFEYTQAIVRAQFDEPANVVKRARYFFSQARETWDELILDPSSASPLMMLNAAARMANATASLTRAPIPERRLLAELPACAQKLGNPDLVKHLLDIIAGQVSVSFIREQLPAWEAAFSAAAQSPTELSIHPARLGYYKSAIETFLESDFPLAALWPMLHTWVLAVESGNLKGEQKTTWKHALGSLGLDAAGMPDRLQALEKYLDLLDEILEQTAT